MKPIPFWENSIRIDVHSASSPALVGQRVSIQDFAGNGPASLYLTESGDLLCRLPLGDFIEGPEFVPVDSKDEPLPMELVNGVSRFLGAGNFKGERNPKLGDPDYAEALRRDFGQEQFDRAVAAVRSETDTPAFALT